MKLYRSASTFALTFLLLLCACGDDPLPKPELLNHPESEWPERTKTMSTKELFDVYRYHLSLKPPYDTSFPKYLGVRGQEAVLLWVSSLETDQAPAIDRPYLFGPIIQDAYYQGGYDLCSDPETLNRAAKALIRPKVARDVNESLTLIRSSCVNQLRQRLKK